MLIQIVKGERDDRIVVVRSEGSTAETRFPKKGPVPHDAVHYFAERGFGLTRGFWGMVAAGTHPEELGAMARAGGHASATRAGVPDAAIVELVQAERIVEAFEADLWSSAGDDANIAAMIEVGCRASLVPPPEAMSAIPSVRDTLADFSLAWMEAAEGAAFTLTWD